MAIEKILLDWILADVDIISFILQPLPGVKNQQNEKLY